MANSIRLTIKSMYKDFTPKEQMIADYILKDPKKIGQSTITDISNDLKIADSTFFRFTKKIGFLGFKEFKTALLTSEENITTASAIHQNIQPDDNELEIAQKIFNSNISTLVDTKNLLSLENLKTAINYIDNSKRLFFFGVGGSQIVASDAYHKFLRSSISVVHSADYHIQLMETSLMTGEDCAILISHTGRSKETIQLAKAAKNNGAPIIVVTSQIQSPLAKLADVVFISISEETTFRSEALASRISQLSILDAIYTNLMFRNQEQSQKSISKIREVINVIKEQN